MKRISVVLVIALVLCMAATAYAVPSKTTSVVTVIGVTQTGVAPADDFKLGVGTESAEAVSVLQDIVAFVDGGKTVSSFFDSVLDEIALHFSCDLAELSMNEFVPLSLENYDSAYGDLQVALALQAKYEPGQEIAVVGGIITGVDANGKQIVEWTVLDAFVNDEGEVVVTLTQEFLEQLANGSAVLAILSAPVE